MIGNFDKGRGKSEIVMRIKKEMEKKKNKVLRKVWTIKRKHHSPGLYFLVKKAGAAADLLISTNWDSENNERMKAYDLRIHLPYPHEETYVQSIVSCEYIRKCWPLYSLTKAKDDGVIEILREEGFEGVFEYLEKILKEYVQAEGEYIEINEKGFKGLLESEKP